MTSRVVTFHLALDADEVLRYYRGSATEVVVHANDGRTVRFPASALRPHMTRNGVSGTFALVFDEHNRLVSLDRHA
jgi:hypothetical protein